MSMPAPRAPKRLSHPLAETPAIEGRHFEFFCDLIYRKSGIILRENKKTLLTTRLGRRLRLNGFGSWDEYIALLRSGDAEEMTAFVNVMTTNKTEFFREEKHFDYLTNQFFPELARGGQRPVNFWIAAASTGQEVYTLAMILEQFNLNHAQNPINGRILATDIDTESLAKAEMGVFDKSLVTKQVPPTYLRRHFLQGTGANRDLLRFDQSTVVPMKFRYHNLCDYTNQLPVQFQLIMLRNVLIYFESHTVEKVIDKMLKHLAPGGLLILGHCESILEMKWPLDSVSQSVYRKRS